MESYTPKELVRAPARLGAEVNYELEFEKSDDGYERDGIFEWFTGISYRFGRHSRLPFRASCLSPILVASKTGPAVPPPRRTRFTFCVGEHQRLESVVIRLNRCPDSAKIEPNFRLRVGPCCSIFSLPLWKFPLRGISLMADTTELVPELL